VVIPLVITHKDEIVKSQMRCSDE